MIGWGELENCFIMEVLGLLFYIRVNFDEVLNLNYFF